MATYTVSSGQTVSGVTLNTGDTMNVLKGGSAINTTINGPGNGDLGQANQYVSGQASGTVVNNGGSQEVDSGGVATGTVVNNVGEIDINSGGAANNLVMNSGGFGELFGGNINGITVNSGGNIGAAGGTITGAVLNGGEISEQTTTIDRGTIVNKGGIEFGIQRFQHGGPVQLSGEQRRHPECGRCECFRHCGE